MSSEVLVTVVGKVRRGDVCLDDQVPIASLVPGLGRHYADTVEGELVLTDDRGYVLNPDVSLRDAGVTHGAKLTLRRRGEVDGFSETMVNTKGWPWRQPPPVETPDIVAGDRLSEEAPAHHALTTGLPTTAVPMASAPVGVPLSPPEPPPSPAPRQAQKREVDVTVNPIQRSRALLPKRFGIAHRVRRSMSAAAGRQRRAHDQFRALRATPSPAELTLPDAPGPIARWRKVWDETEYLHRLDQAIARPQLARCATVAVVSPKGGVGKTTTTALLGTLVAHLRRDLVLAVDANPDYGSLGRVLCPDNVFFVDDIEARLNSTIPSMADLNAWLGAGPHGLRVLPAPTDPARMSRIGFDVYSQVIRRMQDYAGMLLVDCGTGIHEPAAQAALAAADQVVIVSDSDPATASLVSEAASRMPKTGPLTLVVNKMPARGSRLDLDRLAETLPGVDTMVVIPAEAKAASMLGLGAFTWTEVPGSWQRAVRELAAVLIAGWPELGLVRE
jgi:MinD-like ATPase involved in chromosome partitioning or flagellar assembly